MPNLQIYIQNTVAKIFSSKFSKVPVCMVVLYANNKKKKVKTVLILIV